MIKITEEKKASEKILYRLAEIEAKIVGKSKDDHATVPFKCPECDTVFCKECGKTVKATGGEEITETEEREEEIDSIE